MLYKILAELVVLIHLAFILFALFGGLLTLHWRWMPWIHLPAVTWGAAVEAFGWFCPLTPLENILRHAGGSVGYSGGFSEQYLIPIIYPEDLTRELQLFLGLGLVIINLIVYLLVWYRWHTHQGHVS